MGERRNDGSGDVNIDWAWFSVFCSRSASDGLFITIHQLLMLNSIQPTESLVQVCGCGVEAALAVVDAVVVVLEG